MALIGMLLLMILVNTILGVSRRLIPEMAVLRSLIYLVAGLEVSPLTN